MSYQTTQFLYFFRKLSRSEDRKGDLKKRFVAFFIVIALILFWKEGQIGGKLIRDYEEAFLIKSFFDIRGDVPTPDEIAIVKIDDLSFQKLNLSTRRPFPRELFAKALKAIAKDEPKVVILDVHAPFEEQEAESTKEFAEALRAIPSTIARATIGDEGDNFTSDPILRDAASMELPMMVDSYKGLVYFMVQQRLKNSPNDESVPLIRPLRQFVDPSVKLPKQNSMINFYGKAGDFPAYSIWQLFSEKRVIPPSYFKDKIVFLGFASDLRARGTSDKELIDVTAPGGVMYGVEVQATIAANLLEQNYINRFSHQVESLIVCLLLFTIIIGIFFLEPKSAFYFMLTFIATWFVGSYLAFTYLHFFIPGAVFAFFTVPTVLAVVATVVATLTLRELEENKRMLGIK